MPRLEGKSGTTELVAPTSRHRPVRARRVSKGPRSLPVPSRGRRSIADRAVGIVLTSRQALRHICSGTLRTGFRRTSSRRCGQRTSRQWRLEIPASCVLKDSFCLTSSGRLRRSNKRYFGQPSWAWPLPSPNSPKQMSTGCQRRSPGSIRAMLCLMIQRSMPQEYERPWSIGIVGRLFRMCLC